MTYLRYPALSCFLILALVACGDDDTSGTDGGDTRQDGGPGSDAGPGSDSGSNSDASAGDGGNVTDGAVSDSGSVTDGGGANDAGPGADGGKPVDAGPTADGGKPVDRCSDLGMNSECIACSLEAAPQTEADCACPACPSFPATRDECRVRLAASTRVCAEWRRNNPCPVLLCTAPPPVTCVDGECRLLTRSR